MVFAHFLQYILSDEPLKIIHEYGAAREPLAIQLTPDALGPTGFADGKVQAAVDALLPVKRRYNVPQRVVIVMLTIVFTPYFLVV